MAIIVKRALSWIVPVALVASLLGLAISAYSLYQGHALNTRIALREVKGIDDDAAPRALFARAYQLRQDGKLGAALALYQKLEQVADREIRIRASYNIGNIYVMQARMDALLHRVKNIGTLASIARAQYQRALRLESDFYNAKYNLEYTRFLVTERDLDQQDYEGGLSHRHEFRKDWAEFQQPPQGLP